MTRRRRVGNARKQLEAAATSRAGESTRLAPLLCAQCGAPQAVGDDDDVRCRGCGATTAVPPEYRMLRDAHRLSASDGAQLDALYAEVSRPPPAWERVAVVVGYTVGIATLVVLALGAVIGAIGGAAAGDKAGDTIATIFAAIGAVVVGFIAVPFAGEWVIAFLTTFDADVAMNVATAPIMNISADLRVAAVLYFLGVVPIALAWRTSQSISGLEELQRKLAATPASTPEGGACCRSCGAPLDVKPGALGTRCLYCGSDNLLRIPRADAEKKKDDATVIDKEVQAAVASFQATKRSDRSTTMLMLGAGVLLAPVLCAAGWVLHRLFAA